MFRPIIAAALLLPLSTAAFAEPKERDAGEKVGDARDKMICKRFAETGSLVGKKRICKTKAEWELGRAALRDQFAPSQSCGQLANGGSC